ncbi:dTDP-4-dehydrorhamnose reductase [Shinella sp. SUS2]|uniref:dTDP-4-dehydrorhamnose reductase n=1 Tax=unclassified Shinella TaxID=2643062 RepID=UPI0006811D13|nr:MULTISPECIES: dTDP-4-dehydrorhamnose reductase [unclassified Shinella]KNY13341.1 dTDP-4-dehydrorhamnose reductase [Shinella sp. SUS2]KOC72211.1 dTDP-4-dehydrorhamnose reductase [Shinella sp. GWS1]
MDGKRKRMVVTGREGQVVRSLLERGALNERFEVVALGRPELDLRDSDGIAAVLRQARPDVIVSAAAYTAVDRAETEEAEAYTINAVAPGRIAAAAAGLGIPVIHLSTDYVFDGEKLEPYLETDPVGPVSAYGRTKLAGERAVVEATDNHVILRTAWVYSPFGRNFLKTMLTLAESRDQINVVDDQRGSPTSALDIADGILAIAGNLLDCDAPQLRGIFHMTGSGSASWADFAAEIFAASARRGGPSAGVGRIPSSSYPTPARRPANSQLDCCKLERMHGVRLADWRDAVARTAKQLVLP